MAYVKVTGVDISECMSYLVEEVVEINYTRVNPVLCPRMMRPYQYGNSQEAVEPPEKTEGGAASIADVAESTVETAETVVSAETTCNGFRESPSAAPCSARGSDSSRQRSVVRALRLLEDIVDETETRGTGGLRGHGARVRGMKVVLNFENKLPESTPLPATFMLDLHTNSEVWEVSFASPAFFSVHW